MAVAYGADAVYLAGHELRHALLCGELHPGGAAARRWRSAHAARRARPCHGQHHAAQRRAAAVCRHSWSLLNDCGVDALILADLGVFSHGAARCALHCELHISTQASIANYACAARAWHELGAKRVVLARELSPGRRSALSAAETPPELELETFCHGAMCVSLLRALPALQLYDGPRQPTAARAPSPAAISTP